MKTLSLLFLCCVAVLAECDAPDVLSVLKPGAQWSISGNDYSTLKWMCNQPKPTEQEFKTAMESCQTDLPSRRELVRQSRLDVKNLNKTQIQRLKALLILLDLDR